MKKAELKLETLTCPSCLMKINKAVRSVKGVNKRSVEVLFNSSKVRFEHDDNLDVKAVKDVIEKSGFKVLEVNA